MNTLKSLFLKFGSFGSKALLPWLICAMTLPAFGQLQWSSYDTSGNLVSANVATGGDAASGTSATFTVPANTRMVFITRNFTPIILSQATAAAAVTFKFSASGGLTGVAQKTVEWGLYNSMGTASLADDMGMFGGWTGTTIEGLLHASGSADLFTGTSTGQGKTVTGAPTDGTTYTNQVRLYLRTAPIGVALGSSSSTLGAAGIAMNGADLTSRLYTNPGNWTNSVDEFALMFNNTTANPVTVTLSAIGLGTALTWDASGANPVAPTDGSGFWSTTNANWSGGAGGAIGAGDDVWLPGYNAILGSGGAPGTVTNIDATVLVHNITFNTNYVLAGNALTLTNGSVITVAGSATTATISSVLAGSGGLTKEGAGRLLLAETANNTYTGDTTINGGAVQPGGTGGQLYIPGNLTINSRGTFNAVSGSPGSGVFGSGVLVINGQNNSCGSNVFVNSGAWISAGTCVLANGAVITNGGGAISGTYAVTNTDARSGAVWLTRHGFGIFNNIYKSTAGAVIISSRPNASASDGYIATLNAGALIFDYAYANNASVRLKANSPLTFAGGTLVFSNYLTTINPSANNPGTGGTFFNPGASSLYSTNAGASGGNMTLGAITRKTGATFNFIAQSGPGNIGSSTANVNGIVGGWNTYNLADWTTGTSAWAPLAAGSYKADLNASNWVAADNVTLNGDTTAPGVPDGTTINTLRLTAASTVTLVGTLTNASGGLLVTGSGVTAITGGTLYGASGADLIVHQNASANLTISSTLADNGAATSLTKDGAGKLILSGVNNMTGTNFLNGGVVEVDDLNRLAGGPLDMNGGTLRYTGLDTTSSRAVTTRGLGPTFDIVGGTTVTQSGAIKGSGDAIGDLGGLAKIGAGTLVLTASNNFNGETVVNGGVLAINGIQDCSKTVWDAGRITVNGGALGGTGVISGPVTIKNGGTVTPGNSIGTLTLATNLTLESGSTSLFEVTNGAAGDVLVVQGNLIIGANSTIAIQVLGTALEPATNTVITYTGSKSGSFNPTVAVVGGSLLNSSLSIDESTPGQIKLVAVPQVAITGQPQNAIVSTNDPVTFTVSATGSAPLGYQWYFTDNINNPAVAIPGANGSSYFIASADGTNNGLYSVVVTNDYNSVTSSVALLIVGNVCSQLAGPFDQTVIQGNNATFSATVVIANPQPTFQWQTNGVDVPGATSTNLTLNNVQYNVLNGATVSLIASNAACIVTNQATLTVIVTPVIAPQPANITANVGDSASFVSGASGIPAPALQWYKNNALLSGQTAGTLSFASAQGSDIANYKLVASNTAGSVTSSVVKLTVLSTNLAQQGSLGPANNGTGVCYDTPLYLSFNDTVSVVNSGRVRIWNATNAVTPVDVIDMSSNSVIVSTLNTGIFLTNNVQPHSLFSGDPQVMNYFPVIITGSNAAIYPHSGVMTSNQTYYVTMDNGVVVDSAGAYFAGISDTNAWRFTTKPTGPANPTNLVVAADGSGDFVTVQGAVDSIPAGNNNSILINIRDGNYVEIVDISGKNNITFRGQSRAGTVVSYQNNNNLTGTTAGRASFKVNSTNIVIENLTLVNTTPQGGSQAETLLIYNNGVRCIVNNCDIVSRQDTILINANTSQGYFYNCKVVGNFDYVWGVGVGYFDHCVFRTITNIYSGSYNLTAARTLTAGSLSSATPWVNPNGTTYSAYGFTFVACTMEADAGLTGITLAGSNGTAGGLDAWVDCLFSTAYVTPTLALSNTYVFWQYNNKDITGVSPVSFANVQTMGVTNNDPRLQAATNITVWFSGWSPASAPNITAQPSGATVSQGQSANFIVAATGVPAPAYQWYKNGVLIPGATATQYPIASAVRTNAGDYTVVVSNGSGSVTSSVATLTYTGNVAPVASPSTYSRPAGFSLKIAIAGDLATYWSDADADPVSLTGGISSTNGATVSYDSAFVYYLNPNDVADQINYTITDGQGGTNSGIIDITITSGTSVGGSQAVTVSGNSATVTFAGIPGYQYQVQRSTNLLDWVSLVTTNAPANGVFKFTDHFLDLGGVAPPAAYYRTANP
jgi:autotransporter-associated beta strand protein